MGDPFCPLFRTYLSKLTPFSFSTLAPFPFSTHTFLCRHPFLFPTKSPFLLSPFPFLTVQSHDSPIKHKNWKGNQGKKYLSDAVSSCIQPNLKYTFKQFLSQSIKANKRNKLFWKQKTNKKQR